MSTANGPDILKKIETNRDGVLIKDNVVWEPDVVGPGHSLASLDSYGGRVEHQSTSIGSQLHVGGIG